MQVISQMTGVGRKWKKRKLFKDMQAKSRKTTGESTGWVTWPGFLVIMLYFSSRELMEKLLIHASVSPLDLYTLSLHFPAALPACLGIPKIHCYPLHFSVLIARQDDTQACSSSCFSCACPVIRGEASESALFPLGSWP